jgi:RimJ/RimL family protein N-acetyltransferase
VLATIHRQCRHLRWERPHPLRWPPDRALIYRAAMPVTLRPLTLDDTDAVHGWAQLPESCRYQTWGPNTYEQTRAYVREAAAARLDRLVFAVLVDGDVVGTAELMLRGPSTAEIGYGVHPRRWGQGIATAAAKELLRMGFRDHGRHRIFGTCDPRNVASASVLRRIGMRYEGRMRGTAYIRDGWRDSDLYAILVDD